MNIASPTKFYLVPCPHCPPDHNTSGAFPVCRGHTDQGLLPPLVAPQPDAPRTWIPMPAPLTEERARELGKYEAEQLLRAAFAGDKDCYLARWLDDRIQEVGHADLDQLCRAVVQEHREKDLHFSEDRIRQLADEQIARKAEQLASGIANAVSEQCGAFYRDLCREEIRAHGAEANHLEIERRVAEKNQRVRDAALEEAAKRIGDPRAVNSGRFAEIIRSMKSAPTTAPECRHCIDHDHGGECCNCGEKNTAGVAQRQSAEVVGTESVSGPAKRDAGSTPAPGSIPNPTPTLDELAFCRWLLDADADTATPMEQKTHAQWIKAADELAQLKKEHREAQQGEAELIAKVCALRAERDKFYAGMERERLRAHKLEQSLQGARAQAQEDIAKCFEERGARLILGDFDFALAAKLVRGMNLTPAAPCAGLESERPAREAPAPTSEQPDRSLSEYCPLCEVPEPERREIVGQALHFALADTEWHADPSPSRAKNRDEARRKFKAAREAADKARR